MTWKRCKWKGKTYGNNCGGMERGLLLKKDLNVLRLYLYIYSDIHMVREKERARYAPLLRAPWLIPMCVCLMHIGGMTLSHASLDLVIWEGSCKRTLVQILGCFSINGSKHFDLLLHNMYMYYMYIYIDTYIDVYIYYSTLAYPKFQKHLFLHWFCKENAL